MALALISQSQLKIQPFEILVEKLDYQDLRWVGLSAYLVLQLLQVWQWFFSKCFCENFLSLAFLVQVFISHLS